MKPKEYPTSLLRAQCGNLLHPAAYSRSKHHYGRRVSLTRAEIMVIRSTKTVITAWQPFPELNSIPKPSYPRIPFPLRIPPLSSLSKSVRRTLALYIYKNLIDIFIILSPTFVLAGWNGIVVYRYPPMMKEWRRSFPQSTAFRGGRVCTPMDMDWNIQVVDYHDRN